MKMEPDDADYMSAFPGLKSIGQAYLDCVECSPDQRPSYNEVIECAYELDKKEPEDEN